MKNVVFFLIPMLFVSCNKDGNKTPCESKSALTLCVYSQRTWECMNMPRPAGSYNYPICPEMEEWKDLKTSDERLEACQVPPCVLEKMSTQAVVQAIWEWPSGFGEFLHRDLYLADLESREKLHNAYIELQKRKDAGTALFERLILVDPLAPQTVFPLSQALEVLTSKTIYLSQLSNNQKRVIIEVALKNDDLRQEYSPPFSKSYRSTTSLLMGRTLVSIGYAPFVQAIKENEELKYFVEGWRPHPYNGTITTYTYSDYYYGNIPQQITLFARQFLHKQ